MGALDRTRAQPSVALPSEGPLRAKLDAVGVRTEVLPVAWWIPATHWSAAEFFAQLAGLPERVEKLCAHASDVGAELIHTNTIVTIEGALAAARLGLPHVWHSRGPFWKGHFPPGYFDDISFFYSVVDQLSDHVICVSREVERQIQSEGGLTARSVIFDGPDSSGLIARPIASREAIEDRYGIDPHSRLVACVGGIQRRKGQLDLVEAAARMAPQFPNLVFVLCGEPGDAEYYARVVQRIDELQLGSRFRFPGFESDVRSLLAHAELLVHPAHSEGFGLAILEAMASGKPVVATRCGGPEEIVEDGVSGLLVPAGDPAALALAMGRILGNPSLAGSLGRAAAERAKLFTSEQTARRTEALYDQLVESERSAELLRLRARRADTILEELLKRAARAATPTAPRRA
jgi:glycosyltransferase involved in cell wall biosynthesis